MRAQRLLCALPGLLIASSLLLQAVAADKRVLVLLQDAGAKDKYSIFFDLLGAYGFKLDIKGHKESGLKLRDYDNWLYDHLIVLAPRADGFGGSIDASSILDFVDSGHNLLLAAGTGVSETIRSLAIECGVDLDDKGTKVFDHFNFGVIDGKVDHTVIASSEVVHSAAIAGKELKAPVLYKGIALSVSPESELASVALSAPLTAYSHDPKKAMAEPPVLLAGSAITLVAAVQARNNARMLVAGSASMFTNDYMGAVSVAGKEYAQSGNRDFLTSAVRWAFQERGVLRAESLRHTLLSGSASGVENPPLYRVNDEVEFALDLFELEGGKKAPYKADDVQVEFTMLDPHVRLTMQHNGKGTYSVRFKVPDVYGVFKYVVQYQHQGYSSVSLTQQVPVRPFRHNEYERFLFCAYPYYASALSTMAAFFAIGFFYLYHK